MTLWLIIAVSGAGTFAIRASLLAFVSADRLPARARHALAFITPAVLTAFILPAVLYLGDDRHFSAGPGNERLLAALAAAAVAVATRNVWLTIAAGMSALWLLRALT